MILVEEKKKENKIDKPYKRLQSQGHGHVKNDAPL